MTLKHLAAAALLLAGLDSFAAPPGNSAFVDVSVIPMDRERVLSHQTVLVASTRITVLGPAVRTPVPEGFVRIDGHGAYLLPGLADMHTHVNDSDELLMYIASGVTTLLHMGLAPAEFVDHVPGEVDGGEPRHADITSGQRAPRQVLTQHRRRVPDGVTLGHWLPQPHSAWGAGEAGVRQSVDDRTRPPRARL